jgi:hypothetical protein
MRLHTIAVGSAVTILALSGLVASTASATPPVNPTPPSPNPPPEAILAGPLTARADGIKLKIRDDAVVRNFTLTYLPGANSGWHAHPGIVLAVVKTGTVHQKLPCQRAKKFTVGQAFTEAGPHFVENRGDVNAELIITQIAPAGTVGPEFREDLPKPRCRS